ncbi:gamma-glutamyl-gamma-aminobutyrate hydrolase family protein [Kutzneria viridogrisea]|uniref:Glutamine amidotransferase n=1 Tax=Kutzneria viridogrisea TaxID=47990 RepID=A0ABR6BKN0_9PSEU|nr:putative glutamine amidotransferase [Kutzneria viridogrisea]
MKRPLIVIPARFSASASALRYGAVVTARALSGAVLRAGGEPLTVHPDGAELDERFAFAEGVLLPGGGDLDPSRYGHASRDESVYDVDAEQDEFDLAVARWALRTGRPLLAVCRGMQVVNVALGGTLEQHMASPHRHLVHTVTSTWGEQEVSCYHHQRVDQLGAGLVPVAHAADGTVEAVRLADPAGWFLGVQWHPEDTPSQDGLFRQLVAAAQASTVPPSQVTPICR